MASPPNSSPLTFNVPMALTWARIAMIPVIVGVGEIPDKPAYPAQGRAGVALMA